MKKIVLAMILSLVLTACSSGRLPFGADKNTIPKNSQTVYNDYSSKSTPGAYKPVCFEIPQNEIDQEQKQRELGRLREHNLISEQEFEERLPVFGLEF